jgi:cellulose synthase/poly-beta-1,6-N-acetylglucosamine synthase-like glycosyltransferase
MTGSPRITVIFPLYHAAKKIPILLERMKAQRHPQFQDQYDWLRVIWIDNASTDGTAQALREALALIGSPSHHEVVVNPENLGLSRSLNKAFSLVQTPFALTCHSDCLFGQDDYVYRMLDLLERNPKTGAITGQPSIPSMEEIPFVEKVNLVANLMDLFPVKSSQDLISVGFAEGRCDAFRMDALRSAGFYDTTLRLAGEDQILAARMREHGFEVCQAPSLIYFLSVSVQQDTLSKLLRHQQRFGRAHPYILLMGKGTWAGAGDKTAGKNRQSRTLLRFSQLLATAVYFFCLVAAAFGAPYGIWLGALLGVFLMKLWIFRHHLLAVHFRLSELLRFFGAQPAFDVFYTVGLLQGLWSLTRRAEAREIS